MLRVMDTWGNNRTGNSRGHNKGKRHHGDAIQGVMSWPEDREQMDTDKPQDRVTSSLVHGDKENIHGREIQLVIRDTGLSILAKCWNGQK